MWWSTDKLQRAWVQKNPGSWSYFIKIYSFLLYCSSSSQNFFRVSKQKSSKLSTSSSKLISLQARHKKAIIQGKNEGNTQPTNQSIHISIYHEVWFGWSWCILSIRSNLSWAASIHEILETGLGCGWSLFIRDANWNWKDRVFIISHYVLPVCKSFGRETCVLHSDSAGNEQCHERVGNRLGLSRGTASVARESKCQHGTSSQSSSSSTTTN